jgi:predicted metal-binding protein
MVKIGIIICERNKTCTGNKCFMAIKEREGAFSQYPEDEPIDVVGFISCGGCPGERLEYSPADMKKYGAEVIHLATGYLAGYPACPYIKDHIEYIETVVGLLSVVGTHPMPQNYVNAHESIGDWNRDDVRGYLKGLVENERISLKYDSTRPNFLERE